MSKHQVVLLILSRAMWAAVAVFNWIPHYPRGAINPNAGRRIDSTIAAPIEVGSGRLWVAP